MKKPVPNLHVDQLVSADGQSGTFRIGKIDSKEGTADLVHTAGTGHVVSGIPLSAIHPLKEDFS